MNAIEKCESCSNLDLSYNGLGDNEAEHLGKALKKNYSGNDKPYAGVSGARLYGASRVLSCFPCLWVFCATRVCCCKGLTFCSLNVRDDRQDQPCQQQHSRKGTRRILHRLVAMRHGHNLALVISNAFAGGTLLPCVL
jgi:hypothetical protein